MEEREVAMNWISVRDKLPPTHRHVLVYIPDEDKFKTQMAEVKSESTQRWVDCERHEKEIVGVTHWMFLPKAPKFPTTMLDVAAQANHLMSKCNHHNNVESIKDAKGNLVRDHERALRCEIAAMRLQDRLRMIPFNLFDNIIGYLRELAQKKCNRRPKCTVVDQQNGNLCPHCWIRRKARIALSDLGIEW